MPAKLHFKQADRKTDATTLVEIKTLVYEDNTGNKCTFGVNGTNVFDTFKYEPNGHSEVDYSAIATSFMTDGAVSTLLDRLSTIETATNAANLGDKVTAIKDAVSKPNLEDKLKSIQDKANAIPDDLEDELTTIKTETGKITAIETNVDAIQTKTDKMPADLGTELGKLATSAALSTLDGKVDTITTETNKIAAIGTNVGKIETKTDKIPADLGTELGKLATSAALSTLDGKVDTITTKTDKIPADLGTELGKLATSAALSTLDGKVDTITTETNKIAAIGTNVGKIETKTDKMPADLNAELDKLTVIENAIDKHILEPGAKAKLQSTFDEALKKTIDDPQFKIDIQPILENKFKEAVDKAIGTNAQGWFNKNVTDIMSQPSFEIPTSDDAALNWTW
ncbi:hypothetical protein [Wolbachia endosymbiont of Psylliodes chrysocephala]|uniref:hypothetical protein n=1 Tax=Wolbachia endosymbiont of Psylliodes chrysocephala TaxID=2883236 RepID=UPI0020A1805E|nr:hypothetical protein [Wolbachia endosymbiont of Psylliodes chrysocephala]